jgi:hypothetical protein
MKSYHVEFEFETMDDAVVAPGEMLEVRLPADALVSDITPKDAVAGWYQDTRPAEYAPVYYWDEDEIEDFGSSNFFGAYRRVKEPEVWVAESEGKYKDGSYLMDGQYKYHRVGGVWYFELYLLGDWAKSEYNDETIVDDYYSIEYQGLTTWTPDA